jgi:hypothetical protein
MKWLTVLMFILLILPSLLSAQEDVVSDAHVSYVKTSIPGIVVNAAKHDLGDIYWGRPITHTFTVRNHSEQTIAIQRIRSDCGCTAMVDDTTPMKPGDTRFLTVTYEPEYHEGSFSKRVTVYTDYPEEQGAANWFELTLSGRIVSILSFDPWHIFFKRVTEGQESETVLHIHADRDESVGIQQISTDSEYLQAVLEPVSPASETSPTEWKITLTLLDSAPAGAFSSHISIDTDHDIQKTIRLRVLAYIRGAVSIFPTQCYLGTLDPGQVVKKTFTVEKAGDTPDLDPPVIQSSYEWLSYTVETIEENRQYDLVVTISVPDGMSGRFSGQFVIETNDASTPRFEVPVFGFILTERTDPSSGVAGDDAKSDLTQSDETDPEDNEFK